MAKGERIKALREKMGYSQTEFAERVKISKQTLYKYENNIISNIPSDVIERMASILNCPPGYFMGWEDPEPESGLESFWDFFIKSAKSEGCKLWKYERAGNYENKEPFYSENLSMDNMVTIFKQTQNDSGKMSQSASRTVKQINDYIIRHCKNIIQDILSGNDLISSEQDYFRFDDLLLESYRAADPGIQDSICKLLDIDNKTEALKKGSA